MMTQSLPECSICVKVENTAFDVSAALREAQAEIKDGSVGALVSFVGLCRDEGGRLAALEIEHFPIMAQQEIEHIATKAALRFPLLALHIIHRYGLINVGEEIVLVIAASAHRMAAFAGAEFVMDYLKTQAPFWKKQHWRNKEHQGLTQSEWVCTRLEDFERQKRW